MSNLEIDREKDILNYQLTELNELDLDIIEEDEIVDEFAESILSTLHKEFEKIQLIEDNPELAMNKFFEI